MWITTFLRLLVLFLSDFLLLRVLKKELNEDKVHSKALLFQSQIIRYPAKMDDLAALQDEHETAVFKAEQLKEVLDKMRALDTDFDQMILRLSTIQGIWNMVGIRLFPIPYLLI